MNQERQLITIIVSPNIEDTILDWFLAQPNLERFVSYEVKSYNKEHLDYSILEKVTGWKRKTAFRVVFPREEIPRVITEMKRHFANSGIYYEVTPFFEEGVL